MATLASRRSSPVRSLADDVRGRSDDQLRALVRRRPDLARPAPSDLTSLAARAGTRASVQRALDGLDRGHLQVLEALVVAGDPVDLDQAATLLGCPSRALARFVDTLWTAALLWRGSDGLHVVRAVAEVLGPHPAGLGPSFADLRGSVPGSHATGEAIDALVEQAPPDARAILDRLTWGPPVGVLGTAGPTATAGSWLLAAQLISPLSADHVVVPREVALRLRGGRLHRELDLEPPPLELTTHPADSVDDAAGGQASDLLGLVDELASDWGPRPPRVLRAGGLAVRDLRRLATVLDVDTAHAAFVAEIAYVAGLVADDGSLEPVWAPTPAYDEWQQRPSAERWSVLAAAWLVSGRAPHLVGSTPSGGSGTVNALSSDVLWPPTRQLRGDVLHELADLQPGEAPAHAALSARIRWRRPLRRAEIVDAVVAAVVREAEWLGVTGRGALGGAGRALVGRERGAARRPAGRRHVHGLAPALARRARPAAGRPDRRRPRSPRGQPGPVHAARRRRRVAGRGDRLPLLRRQPASRPGRRLVVGADPHRAAGRQPHPGAAAAGVPRRRRRPSPRADPGGLGHVVHPQ